MNTDRPAAPAPPSRLTRAVLLAACVAVSGWCGEAPSPRPDDEPTSRSDPEMAAFLRAYPLADADGDGVLILSEFQAFLPQEALGALTNCYTHLRRAVPLRDGTTAPAELFLPRGAAGPVPVVLCRTAYSRFRLGGYIRGAVTDGDVAFVAMDARRYDPLRATVFADPEDARIDIDDMWDTLEWLTRQPWCNGRVMTVGGSGNGQPSSMGFWCGHPAYVVNRTGNTAGQTKYYWYFHNGCARAEYRWIAHRGGTPSAQRPTVPRPPYDPDGWMASLRGLAATNRCWYSGGRGWYDPLVQGPLDDFTALQHGGRAFVTVGATGHGGLSGFGRENLRFPERRRHPLPAEPDFARILRGEEPDATRSTLRYFLMGDLLDEKAPGNEWRATHVWPVPSVPTPYYFHADGTLGPERPGSDGQVRYAYDPRNPAPTLGGHWTWSAARSGPHDQRPLRQRADVVYFVSRPLVEPLTVVGRIGLRLQFSTDVRDTGFVVKLIDIYPDGYEAILRESAGMGRFWNGYADPRPLEPGRVYGLSLDLWSTANVFNTGHRIAVVVTGSSRDAYEVHPNTWETVADYSHSPVATHVIRCSAAHPSHVLLPVVAAADGAAAGSR